MAVASAIAIFFGGIRKFQILSNGNIKTSVLTMRD